MVEQLTEEQIAEFKEAFSLFDNDGDEALQLVLQEVKPGVKVVDLCEKGDTLIRDLTVNDLPRNSVQLVRTASPFRSINPATMSGSDPLFSLKNNFYLSAYQAAINESNVGSLTDAAIIERDSLVYRSYVALGSH